MAKFSTAVVMSLYRAGVDEDGEEVVGESFCVCAEAPDGRRFYHPDSFRSVAVGCDEDGPLFRHNVEGARREAEDVLAGLDPANPDVSTWLEGDPAYGSEAYQKLDSTGFFYDREKEEDAERGFS